MPVTEKEVRELYVEQGLSQQEAAEELGYESRQPIRTALEKYGIEARTNGGYTEDEPWKDKETLLDLYHSQNMNMKEVAEELGCTAMSVHKYLHKYDIQVRSPKHTRAEVPLCNQYDGYVSWSHGGKTVFVHRLAAVAWYGFESVSDRVVHHENGVKYDNRESNLEPMTRAEHRRVHNQ